MNAELCREAVELFRSTPVYDRLLKAVKARYQSLGRVGGTVSLTNLTPADREALSRFFGRNYSQQERLRISVQSVAYALASTRFATISLIELLETYFGEALVTETERAEEWQQQWGQLFAALLQLFPDEYCQQWLSELLQKHGTGYKLVLKKFNTDREMLQKDLATVCTALSIYRFSKVNLSGCRFLPPGLRPTRTASTTGLTRAISLRQHWSAFLA